jgi:MFS family permease
VADTEAAPRAKLDWGRYGRGPVMLLAAVALIDSVDRGILPGVLTHVQDDLGFSDAQAGVLGSVFILMGFLTALPAGYLADHRRRTRLIAVVLGSWGAISALNAAVRSYLQFLGVRAALGIGESMHSPAAQSLLADYYPAQLRGRAYALQRVAPVLGTAVGLGVGGAVGAALGWRWAFLIVGGPGSLLALRVWRLSEPRRGESDRDLDALLPAPDVIDAPIQEVPARLNLANLRSEVGIALRVRTLRSLMIGTAISTGATAGFGFWATAFYERHTSLSSAAAAGLVGGLILVGAAAGTLVGGAVTDRLRDRYEGAPMLVAGVSQFAAGVVLAFTYLHVPLALRIPGQVVGVMLIIAAFPALAAMTSEVVPAAHRGVAFSLTGFLSALASAISPLLIGVLADRFPMHVDGKIKGNLADAFLIVTPLVLVGALVVLRGRRYVAADTANAAR